MLYYLTVAVNGQRQNSVLLNELPSYSRGRITIGRADTCDVVLPYAEVSRNHAVIEFSGSSMEIVDTGSLNKLRVSGKVVERARLTNGMKVVIGSPENNIMLQFNTVDEIEKPKEERPKEHILEKRDELPRKRQIPSAYGKSCVGARIFAFLTDLTVCMFMGIGSAIIMLLLLNQILSGIKVIVMFTIFISLFIIWLYFALGDSSVAKGTMGKMALGLWVIDIKSGDRISFGKASKRFFAKILSTLILFIGYFPIFGKKQTLHDYIAGTAVVRNPRAVE